MRTAEILLQERSIADVSVDDLARGAGISRSAFYFYFPSKDAVVLTLVDRIVEDAAAARDAASEAASDPIAGWRSSIEVFYEVIGSQRAVVRAAVDLSAINAEARALWAQILEGWVDDVAARIGAERARGAAPEGLAARDLATVLVQANERVLRAIFVDEAPAVAEESVIDVLSHIWLSTIYGAPSSGVA